MKYEIFNIKDINGGLRSFVMLYLDGENIKTFPTDESNADFVAFTEANPDWNK